MDCNRGCKKLYPYALFLHVVNFGLRSRHLLPCPSVKDENVLGAKPQGGPCNIYGNVSTSHYHHPLAKVHILSEIYVTKVVHPVKHTLQVFPGNT